MDITIDEMFRRLLLQMQKDTELSAEEKEKVMKKLENSIEEEEHSHEEK